MICLHTTKEGMLICPLCGKEERSHGRLEGHFNSVHKITISEWYLKAIKEESK
jgi:hypothetical protein